MAKISYFGKKHQGQIADPNRQAKHEEDFRKKQAYLEALENQDLPVGKNVESGGVQCPYPACGHVNKGYDLRNGVNICSGRNCGRKFIYKRPEAPKSEPGSSANDLPARDVDAEGWVECLCGAYKMPGEFTIGKPTSCIYCNFSFVPRRKNR